MQTTWKHIVSASEELRFLSIHGDSSGTLNPLFFFQFYELVSQRADLRKKLTATTAQFWKSVQLQENNFLLFIEHASMAARIPVRRAETDTAFYLRRNRSPTLSLLWVRVFIFARLQRAFLCLCLFFSLSLFLSLSVFLLLPCFCFHTNGFVLHNPIFQLKEQPAPFLRSTKNRRTFHECNSMYNQPQLLFWAVFSPRTLPSPGGRIFACLMCYVVAAAATKSTSNMKLASFPLHLRCVQHSETKGMHATMHGYIFSALFVQQCCLPYSMLVAIQRTRQRRHSNLCEGKWNVDRNTYMYVPHSFGSEVFKTVYLMDRLPCPDQIRCFWHFCAEALMFVWAGARKHFADSRSNRKLKWTDLKGSSADLIYVISNPWSFCVRNIGQFWKLQMYFELDLFPPVSFYLLSFPTCFPELVEKEE